MKMLFESESREDAHHELDRVLKKGTYPLAECREDPNAQKPFQVWSAPVPASQTPHTPPAPPSEPMPVLIDLADEAIEKLADALADKVAERLKKKT